MRDILYAWRLLRRAPFFSVAAITTLGLGIGANIAIFTVVNAVLLKPIAVSQPDRLVSIFVTDRHNPGHTPISTYNFRDLRSQSHDAFSDMTAIGFAGCTVAQRGESPRQAVCQPVTANYFDVVGVAPFVGTGFRGDEDAPPGAHPAAVLSYGAWARLFGSDRGVVGRSIALNGRDFTVTGVMPPSFKGTATLFAPDLWFPLSMYEAVQAGTPWIESRRWRWLAVVARLKPTVSLSAAQATVATIAHNLERDYPDVNAGRSFEVIPLMASLINPDQRGGYVRAAWLLVMIVVLVLLIACANLANLLLARAAGRQKEIAVRLALGATRARVIRQMLTESVLLAVCGGAVGLLLAEWMQSLLWSIRPAFLAQPGFELTIDRRALVFASVVSLVSGAIFGLVPALQASGTDLDRTLRQGGRQTSSGARNVRGAFVIAEVAFAVIGLTAAGLFLHSLRRAQQIDPGFEASRLLTVGVNPTAAGYDASRQRVWIRQTLERIVTMPGVRSATFADRLPFNGGIGYTVTIDGQAPPPGGLGYTIQLATIGPHYFETMGLPLLNGRDFDVTDREGTPQVAIINETMARRFWPGENPLGKRMRPLINTGPIQIVGVVRDSRYVTLGEDPTPFFYIPLEQQPRQGLVLLVRTEGRPDAVQGAVTGDLRRADPQLPIGNVATMPELGIYGVMAHSVSQRTYELGLRMALGAQGRDVLRLVIGQGMTLAVAGGVIGLAIAVASARFVASLLYGIEVTDPVTLSAVAVLFGAVSLVACWLPARRAVQLDPVVILRGE